MVEQDSYRGTFASWVVDTTVTKVRGGTILESLGLVTAEVSHGRRELVSLQYTIGEEDMSARPLKESTQQRSQ